MGKYQIKVWHLLIWRLRGINRGHYENDIQIVRTDVHSTLPYKVYYMNRGNQDRMIISVITLVFHSSWDSKYRPPSTFTHRLGAHSSD